MFNLREDFHLLFHQICIRIIPVDITDEIRPVIGLMPDDIGTLSLLN
jgi:hypothetical protein